MKWLVVMLLSWSLFTVAVAQPKMGGDAYKQSVRLLERALIEPAIASSKEAIDKCPTATRDSLVHQWAEGWFDEGMTTVNRNPGRANTFFRALARLLESYDLVRTELYGMSLLKMGITTYFLQDYEQALLQMERAHAILNDVNGEVNFATAQAYNAIGAALVRLGDYENSLAHYEHTLSVYKQVLGEEHDRVAGIMMNVGHNYMKQRKYTKAEFYLLESLAMRIRTNDRKSSIGTSYINLGKLYLLTGELDRAIEYYRKALTIKTEQLGAEHPIVAGLIQDIGVSLSAAGFHELALEYFANAREIFNKPGNKRPVLFAQNNIESGRVYAKLGQYERAISHYDQALETLGVPVAKGKLVPDLKDISVVSPPEAFRTLRLKAQALYEQGKLTHNHQSRDWYEQSLASFEQAFTLVDQMRISFRSTGSREFWTEEIMRIKGPAMETCYALHQLAGGTQYAEKAFEVAEKSRANQLLASLRQLDLAIDQGIPFELLMRERTITTEIQSIEKANMRSIDPVSAESAARLRELRLARDSLVGRYEQQFPGYYRQRFSGVTASVPLVRQQLISPGTALLEYLSADSVIFVVAVTSDSICFERIAADSVLQQQLETYRSELAKPAANSNVEQHYHAYTRSGHYLWQQLVGCVGPLIQSGQINRFQVIPGTRLGSIPFEALLTDPAGKAVNYHQLPYAIRKFRMQYAYSATLLCEVQQRSKSTAGEGAGLAFAPVYFGESLVPLENTLREIQVIAGEQMAHEKATESAFKQRVGRAKPYQSIHLATHAFVDSLNPFLSNIRFSPDSAEDAILYGHEIQNLPFECELMVLSACETGVGLGRQGGEIQSLGWLFMNAGCQSVVMSFWQIKDDATAALMERFYEGLYGGLAKDEALQQAKLRYLNEEADELRAHPHYWAGFAGLGNRQPITGDAAGNNLLSLLMLGMLLVLVGVSIAVNRPL